MDLIFYAWILKYKISTFIEVYLLIVSNNTAQTRNIGSFPWGENICIHIEYEKKSKWNVDMNINQT
jgi:hypothetical protein